tara:strand:- start:15959 stop:17353 length:1395 start_codon:yes stop_codon:yes gene_type:complete
MTTISLSKWIQYDNVCAQDYLIQLIIDFLSKSDNIYSNFIKHVTLNKFIGDINKDLITHYFHIATRNRFLVRKTIRNWIFKRRHLHYINDTDLLLEPFDNTKEYPKIVDNLGIGGWGIYRFRPGDIYQLIIGNLQYSEYQMPRILPIKNPWSNKILSKIELYNLFISSYKIHKTPWLFVEYAKLDFNNTLFLRRHNSFLTEKAVYNDVLNLSEQEFRDECEKIFKYNISNTIVRYGHLKYNSLNSINIGKLRKFFTQIIFDINLKDGFSLSITNKQKQSLFNLWSEYPHIITKINKQTSCRKKRYYKGTQTINSNYDLDISRARMLYAYNEIMHFAQNSNPNRVELSPTIPDIMDVSFESLSPSYPRTTVINLRDPHNTESNFDRIIRPPISFRIEGRNYTVRQNVETNPEDIEIESRSGNYTESTNSLYNRFTFNSSYQRQRIVNNEIAEVWQEDSDQYMPDY